MSAVSPLLSVIDRFRIVLASGIALSLALSPLPAMAQESDPVLTSSEEDTGPYGYDGVRIGGGAGYVYTLAPWTLHNDELVLSGNVYGLAAPNWINQLSTEDAFGGGYVRAGLSATKALKGFEFWAGLDMSFGWRVTDVSESINSIGDVSLGAKYAWQMSQSWTLTPFISARFLSGVEDESTYADTFSPEFGAAIGYHGGQAAQAKPFAWLLNAGFDFDRTFRLLSETTRQTSPSTPFERSVWRMTDFPWLNLRTAFDYWTGLGAMTIELNAQLALISGDTSLANGRYNAVVSWRKPIHDKILLQIFAVAGIPTDSVRTIQQQAPYEVGFAIHFGIDGITANLPPIVTASADDAEQMPLNESDEDGNVDEAREPVSDAADQTTATPAASGASSDSTQSQQPAVDTGQDEQPTSEATQPDSTTSEPEAESVPAPTPVAEDEQQEDGSEEIYTDDEENYVDDIDEDDEEAGIDDID